MTPPKTVEVEGREVPLHAHMQAQFARTELIRRALVAGELERVRVEAKWLLDHAPAEGTPSGWDPFVARLRLAASEVVEAPGVDDMAHAVAAMGAACGSCHERLKVEVTRKWDPPPPPSREPGSHMRRHEWAMDRLWDGLVAANDHAWFKATDVFVDASLRFENMNAEERAEPHLQNVEDRLHGWGEEAGRTYALEQRVRLFGQMVATCARCHSDAREAPEGAIER